jgi:exodeoxyribonuclease V gamma subunit
MSIANSKNFRLFTSNRLELLADQLAELVRQPLDSPMAPEIIIVQSKGMERWLALELARRLGICANFQFPFPNAFVSDIIRKVISEVPEPSPFDPKFLTWKIIELLPQLFDTPEFASLQKYLGNERLSLKQVQLAERIADRLDQYLLYRPDWIFRWEQGEENHWQAMLWRALAAANSSQHRAALARRFMEMLADSAMPRPDFPRRIALFGISALPPFHVQILAAISRFTEVNLFLLNPCREFWLDILSDREIERQAGKHGARDLLPEDALHLERGNSLLASMGALGRDFLTMIYDLEPQDFSEFEDPGQTSLLTQLQSDIFHLVDRSEGMAPLPIAADDRSIQVHSCHSPMREVEVLQDQLLHLFQQNTELQPKDVLVMTPDIEIYAPYIQAVFDLPLDDRRRIPFSISDRQARREHRELGILLSLLELPQSRLSAVQVLTLLESPAVRRKFNLTDSEIQLIRQWIIATRIRWGIDADQRRSWGLPGVRDNTWRAGLDRLLLGYAMAGGNQQMFGDILPYDLIEGDDAVVLGKFLEIVEQLFHDVAALRQPKTLADWAEFLSGLSHRYFEPSPDTESDWLRLQQQISDWATIQAATGFTEKIDCEIIRHYLIQALEKEYSGTGFLSGGITFCSLLPMRSIPFAVICLLGMNDNAYPRPEKHLGFDLLAKQPRPGDRSRRKDDRYLFLEVLLSARKMLYISYVGQSIQDNSILPPSVLVSELLDYIDAGFQVQGQKASDHLVTRHRLQAFSPEYFQANPKLFSYASDYFQTAQRLLQPRQSPAPFIAAGLTAPGEKWKEIQLEDLIRFFNQPTRFLLNQRLNIFLKDEPRLIEETEAFDLKLLDRYDLAQELLARRSEGRELSELLPIARAAGRLPHGRVGECLYDDLRLGIEQFVQRSMAFLQASPLEPLPVDLQIDQFHITGKITGIYPQYLVQYRYAKVSGKDRLRLWLQHLLLNLIRTNDYPENSLLIGLHPESKSPEWVGWELQPIPASKALLAELLQLYWQGLVRPLHFFPESAWRYAQRLVEKNQSAEDALKQAQKTWQNNDHGWSESADEYYQLCFRDSEPLNDEFQKLALAVFQPFIEHQRLL